VVAAIADMILVGIAAKRVPAIVREVSPQSDPRFGAAAESEARQRSAKIDAEIAALGIDHEWAGHYYKGNGVGFDLSASIAPQSGFVVE